MSGWFGVTRFRGQHPKGHRCRRSPTDGALLPLFAEALFCVAKLVENFQEMINAYTVVCNHRPDIDKHITNTSF